MHTMYLLCCLAFGAGLLCLIDFDSDDEAMADGDDSMDDDEMPIDDGTDDDDMDDDDMDDDMGGDIGDEHVTITTTTGTEGDDVLEGDDERDRLQGEGGDDTLTGGGGSDQLEGNTGNDSLDGGADDDALFGARGQDTLFGGEGQDFLYGGVGDDQMDGGNGNDELIGGRGSDTMMGGAGDDVLNGFMDSRIDEIKDTTDLLDRDMLDGGDGDDRILLGSGDIAIGGAGADTFVTGAYVSSEPVNVPVIQDFTPADDVIEVEVAPGADYTITVEQLSSFGGSVIFLDGAPIAYVNVLPSEITAANVVAVENPNLTSDAA